MHKGAAIFGTLLVGAALCRTPAAWADDARASAAKRFQSGVAAFESGRFAEAEEEFTAAYREAPAFAVLFNIGQVNVVLGRSVEAVDAFEKYLAEGGEAIPSERRIQVEQELERQRARIGLLALEVAPAGAQIRIDGRLVEESARAEPLRLTSGRHVLEASSVGYVSETREIELLPKATLRIAIELLPAAAAPSHPVQASGRAAHAPQSAPASAQPARERPATGGPSAQRIIGLTVAGLGLTTAVVGGVFAALGVSRAGDARTRANETTDGAVWDEASSDFESAKHQNQIGWLLAGGGAAVLTGGVVLALTAAPRERRARGELGLWLDGRGAGVGIRHSW